MLEHMRPKVSAALLLAFVSGWAATTRAQAPDEPWIDPPAQPAPSAPAPAPPPPAWSTTAPPSSAPSPPLPAPVAPTRAAREEALVPPAWTRDKNGKPKRRIRAEEGIETPPGYRDGTRATPALLVPGVILLPVAYGATLLTSLTCGTLDLVDSRRAGDCGSTDWGWGALPLAGPVLVALDPDVDPGWRTGYALYAIAQHAGLALVITGAAVRQKVWNLEPQYRQAKEGTELHVGPGSFDLTVTF